MVRLVSMSTGVWLGVDYGAAVTVAVLRWPDGRWRALHLDGAPALSSAVFVADDGQLVAGAAALSRARTQPQSLVAPFAHLTDGTVTVSGTKVDVVELVAATLRLVHEHAHREAGGEIAQVRLVVPGWWGPRHRSLIRQAAHRAGWAEPVLVNRPVAVASRLVDDGLVIPVGSWVGVCDVGTRVEASIVRRGADGLEAVSVIDRDAGSDRLDRTLMEYLTGPSPTLPSTAAPSTAAPSTAAPSAGGPSATGSNAAGAPPGAAGPGLVDGQLLAAVRQARQALVTAAAVTVVLPAPWHPIVVTAGQVQALLEPVLEEAAKTMVEAIEAADVDPAACLGVYLTGGGAPLDQLADRLHQAPRTPVLAPGPAPVAVGSSGLPVEVMAQAKLAPVLGAVRTDPLAPATTAGETGPGGDTGSEAAQPRARQAAAMLIPGVAALVLAAQFYATAYVHDQYDNPALTYLVANWAELGLSALYLVLTVLALARALGVAVAADAPGQRRAGGQIGAGLMAAAAGGMTIAALLAIITSIGFPTSHTPFLRWALLAPAPIAAVAALTGAVLVRDPVDPPRGWAARLALPNASILCTAIGMVLIQWANTTVQDPATAGLRSAVALAGAALFGAGVAFALPLPRRFQIIAAAPLTAISAAIGSALTTGLLAGMYIVAVTLWWIRHLWAVIAQQLGHRADRTPTRLRPPHRYDSR